MGFSLRAVVLPVALALAPGCLCGGPVEPAPADSDGAFHWLWLNGGDASDAQVADAVQKLVASTQGLSRAAAEPLRGSLTRLTPEELTHVGLEGVVDPRKARGFYLANIVPCRFEALGQQLLTADQRSLFPERYVGYERRVDPGEADFRAGRRSTLDWEATISGKMLAATYTQTSKGALRRFEVALGGEKRTVWMTRTWMVSPATFDAADVTFPQDAQVEISVERAPGEVLHLWSMWREVRFLTLGLSTDNDNLANAMFDTLLTWDREAGEVCRGLP